MDQTNVTPKWAAPVDDEYQTLEIGFARKKDGHVINVKLSELFRQFKTADFINDEITLKGEVCVLNSFQKKYDPIVLSLVKAGAGQGTFSVDETQYSENHEFTVNKGKNLVVTITPDENSQIDSIKDNANTDYIPQGGVVTLTAQNALTLTITFKAKAPAQ